MADKTGELDMKKVKCIIISLFLYLILGAFLNLNWEIPFFPAITVLFYLLGIIILYFIYYFHSKLSKITVMLSGSNFKEISKYYSLCENPKGYYWIPSISIIIIFGVGGCNLYGSIHLSFTLIWVLVLFCVVVYISIVGYMHYIFLLYFIYSLSKHKTIIKTPEKRLTNYSPSNLELVKEIAKVYGTYRLAFFLTGTLYCIGYAAFCWIPDFQVDKTNPFFIILWIIIYVVIIIFFPLSAYFEYICIKKIVQNLKDKYISDLLIESDNAFGKYPNHKYILIAKTYYETMYAKLIMNSSDYPLYSHFNLLLSILATIFNMIITLASNLNGIKSIVVYLRQIF